jgi:hypothetical protein
MTYEHDKPEPDQDVLQRFLNEGPGMFDETRLEIKQRANSNPGFIEGLSRFVVEIKKRWLGQPPSENNPLVLGTEQGKRFHKLETLQGQILQRNPRRNAKQALGSKKNSGIEDELPY